MAIIVKITMNTDYAFFPANLSLLPITTFGSYYDSESIRKWLCLYLKIEMFTYRLRSIIKYILNESFSIGR